jgi:hypothetical protein
LTPARRQDGGQLVLEALVHDERRRTPRQQPERFQEFDLRVLLVRLWLSKTPYTLCRLRLHAFSDSLDWWRPSSSHCSAHFDS